MAFHEDYFVLHTYPPTHLKLTKICILLPAAILYLFL